MTDETRMWASIWLASLALALAAPSARASDGRIEISHEQIIAGDVTGSGGDAPGYPATLDRSGGYVLTGNLRPRADEVGLEIVAADVDLALGGFAIDGAGDSATLIHGTASNSRVHGGTVVQSGASGIDLGVGAVVESVLSQFHLGDGIRVGDRGWVRGSRAIGSRGTGIVLGENGRVQECLVIQNDFYGLVLGDGSGFAQTTLEGNTPGPVDGGLDLGGNACDGTPSCPCTSCTDFHPDADFDGYGDATLSRCLCSAPSTELLADASDCYDASAQARPGQIQFFATDRGDGSFDYNCDGTEEPEQSLLLGQCFDGSFGGCQALTGWLNSFVPDCGEQGSFLTECGGNDCQPTVITTTTQACR